MTSARAAARDKPLARTRRTALNMVGGARYAHRRRHVKIRLESRTPRRATHSARSSAAIRRGFFVLFVPVLVFFLFFLAPFHRAGFGIVFLILVRLFLLFISLHLILRLLILLVL